MNDESMHFRQEGGPGRYQREQMDAANAARESDRLVAAAGRKPEPKPEAPKPEPPKTKSFLDRLFGRKGDAKIQINLDTTPPNAKLVLGAYHHSGDGMELVRKHAPKFFDAEKRYQVEEKKLETTNFTTPCVTRVMAENEMLRDRDHARQVISFRMHRIKREMNIIAAEVAPLKREIAESVSRAIDHAIEEEMKEVEATAKELGIDPVPTMKLAMLQRAKEEMGNQIRDVDLYHAFNRPIDTTWLWGAFKTMLEEASK